SEDQGIKLYPSMLASSPASMVNQKRLDLGIPNRFKVASSRFSVPKWRATAVKMGSYSFAVPLSCRDPPRTPIGKSATACEFALRLVGGRQHVEQDFGLLQIEGFEPLGEPAVDRGEEIMCFGVPPTVVPEARHACGSTKRKHPRP